MTIAIACQACIDEATRPPWLLSSTLGIRTIRAARQHVATEHGTDASHAPISINDSRGTWRFELWQ